MLISQTSISAGSNVDLSCTSNSDRTRVHQWRWFHNSKLILANDDRYSMNNVTRAHMGMYQCCYIMDSSDSNDCCAQTQVRVISKSCVPFFHLLAFFMTVGINKNCSLARRYRIH